jgi:putative ABC transport system permease protein
MRSLIVASFLAFKSVVRGNAGVTLLTISMLVLVNLNLLFVPSLVNGIVFSANDKLIETYSSNIIIEAEGDNPVIRRVDDLLAGIERIDGVIAVTSRNGIGAQLSYDNERTNCTILGVDPIRDAAVFNIPPAIFEGSYLEPRETGQVLLGVQLAGADRTEIELYGSSLKTAHAGDRITVNFANGLSKQYEIKGVFYTEFIQTDLQAFVTDRDFSAVSPNANNRATQINVKIRDHREASRVIREIQTLRDELKFQTWEDTAGLVSSMTDSFNIIDSILTIVNLLVAGITVFIVTYIDLVNKRRQIGIERAIGITPLAIILSYVMRAIFYAVIGVVLSAVLFLYVVVPIEARYPFHFPFGDVPLFVDGALLLRASLIIFGVAVIAAVLPVLRTLRIRLLDAIWG